MATSKVAASGKPIKVIIICIMALGFIVLCRTYVIGNGRHKALNKTVTFTYPHDGFFLNLREYYRLLIHVQKRVDSVVTSRNSITGTIAWYPSQVYYYARIVSSSKIKNVCELGYGAGLSALLYLTMNPEVTLYSFDLFPVPSEQPLVSETLPRQGFYQNITLDYIKESDGLSHRFHQIAGNSNLSIPKFSNDNPNFKCDLISIDGSHQSPQVYFDILHFRKLAKSEISVLLDDVNDASVRKDMDRAIAEGLLKEQECLIPEQIHDENFKLFDFLKKVFCAARYLI
ncbi:unnamed protein product [Rotaria socialis]|uniref:Class I SAM-dependent methyltransferase n=1 Tax=Rotaria socialis TaxID=392032 RepID=A0A821TRF3_9BILA|nr:unnamed protein product [Rotaria socialis]CAF4878531.1 unnamed protein product [Rotaria socialis]